jgi:hypothetical protein
MRSAFRVPRAAFAFGGVADGGQPALSTETVGRCISTAAEPQRATRNAQRATYVRCGGAL